MMLGEENNRAGNHVVDGGIHRPEEILRAFKRERPRRPEGVARQPALALSREGCATLEGLFLALP